MIQPFLSALRGAALLASFVPGVIWALGGTAAAQSVADVAQVISVTPVPGWRDAPGRHVAGLRVGLKPGWYTYWRSAGSAGISPRMGWSGSRNVRSVSPIWPVPRLFREGGDLSIGYDRGFVLPLIVETAPGPAVLRGRLDLGVCAEICLPVRLEVEAYLPSSGAPDPDLAAALADGPRRSELRADCRVNPTPDGLRLTAEVALPALGGPEAVVFEVPYPSVWVTDAAVRRDGDVVIASSELMQAGGRRVRLDPSEVRITVIGLSGAVELAGCAP
ncbi:protein-disulfide reductase DsbD domain-containing protein [Jannaschia seohaensis]|uniref:DsbC/DsbD-like thiol-disulfide interchange protein n=1 Tax=Jannaschia seohaensis TaxID=475081 RepID=A0A2Y9AAM4_9RHOB|nr:protein-disulfide reductase DsbD domain-containing protein [Jannaschia seohaensis]PWJ21221.1 DsbC/DsbD-like thiol-disulfide interchange protein [Jannaschia seohaensis]SSA41631.1 Thiol-disulfide interchange protein, contains DsbC and DsbD domains [Jannaschia seohaensis]